MNRKHILSIAIALTIYSCGERKVGSANGKLPSDTAAYGPVHFGMNEKEAEKLLSKSSAIIDDRFYEIEGLYIPSDKRLYQITIKSSAFDHDHIYKGLKQDVNSLVEEMTKLYGYPSDSHDAPIADKFQPGIVQWRMRWLSHNKEVAVGAAQPTEARSYYAVCRIVNKPLKAIADTELIYLDLPIVTDK